MFTAVAIPTNRAAEPQEPVTKNGIKKLLAVIKILQVTNLESVLVCHSENLTR